MKLTQAKGLMLCLQAAEFTDKIAQLCNCLCLMSELGWSEYTFKGCIHYSVGATYLIILIQPPRDLV